MQNLGKNTANGRRPRLYGSQIHDSLGIPTDDVRRISFIGPDYNILNEHHELHYTYFHFRPIYACLIGQRVCIMTTICVQYNNSPFRRSYIFQLNQFCCTFLKWHLKWVLRILAIFCILWYVKSTRDVKFCEQLNNRSLKFQLSPASHTLYTVYIQNDNMNMHYVYYDA